VDCPPVWAEINLKAIAHNMREIRRITSRSAQVMAVVKANAYGHGAIEVAREALQNGADFLGVARLDEAIQLREAGFNAPILIFGYTPPAQAGKIVENGLTQTVYSYQMARAFSEAAVTKRKRLKVHLKVDTGMGRLGLLPGAWKNNDLCGKGKEMDIDSVLQEARAIAALPGLKLEGIYTHFATADSVDKTFAIKQFEKFMEFVGRLRRAGLEIPLKHAANSAALIDMPETHLDMVRPGIILYGLYPSESVNKTRLALEPAMQLKTRVAHLKKVPAGFKVSYGATYETKRPTTIATVPIGYADGFSRLLSNRGFMLVYGERAPVVGRVCMDQTMLDVSQIRNVKLEDEVVVFGRQGASSIPVEEIASALDTINYEVVSTVANRVPRIYYR